MPVPPRPAPKARRATLSWRSPRVRALAWQLLVVGLIAGVLWLAAATTLHNMRLRGIRSGFDFLLQPAGFSIGEGWLPYDASDTYARAFLAGLVNTLRVALPAVVLCTLLGAGVGIARFARNALLRGLCAAYVEVFRNIPLLLQMLAWYLVLTETLPGVDEPLHLGRLGLLSKNGLTLFAEDGPTLSPEYLAVLLGLVFYTAAYVAEVVRAGIAAVPRGQLEGAAALGLPRWCTLRRVVLPQALRVTIPPLTNQYLNLVKNSSLAVAVGYPDVVSIANTVLNQSGRAVECITILMAVYLLLSLLASAAMGVFNRSVALRER
jgi:general L-amino acid transport system permease protein